MLGIRRWLASKPFDLNIRDDEWELEWEVDAEMRGSCKREALQLIRLILEQAMGDEACAVYFVFDDEDDCFRMYYCLPDKDEGAYLGWYEMVPPPDYMAKEMVQQLRRKAGITASLSTGKVFYKKQDTAGEIVCRSPSPQDIVLFLGERRPRLINKKAGDKPGTPWRET